MTLKEKLKTNVSINTDGESGRFAEQCEKIADEFAIEFANWIRVCKLKGRPYDFENIVELLETYKEEKGL